MGSFRRVQGALFLGAWLAGASAAAEENVTLDNVSNPGPNQLDEPLANEFSLDGAVRFLDSAALSWQKERQCFTCHTNYAYLYARPLVSSDAPAHAEVRRFAEELIEKRWVENGPRWDAEVVATAAALAFNDAATTRKLHPLTKVALDRMWTVQREDGGWTWLKCGWPSNVPDAFPLLFSLLHRGDRLYSVQGLSSVPSNRCRKSKRSPDQPGPVPGPDWRACHKYVVPSMPLDRRNETLASVPMRVTIRSLR
jgi:hypothetical protein